MTYPALSTVSPAAHIEAVQAPIIPTVAELIQANPGTISLGQGVVHYPPPDEAMARLNEAMTVPERHRYAHVDGLPALLDRIHAKLADENGIVVGDDQAVVVTAGGNMAFLQAMLALVEPGDEVVLLTPYYFNHEMAVGIAGGRAVLVPTDEVYQPQVDAIRAALTERTRAVVTVSPNNPTGAVYDEASLRAVNTLCREHGVVHIHDEAYEYFAYDGRPTFSPGSIDSAAGHTLSLFSLSKAYGMAAWRIGYMVLPRTLLPALKKIQDTNLICAPVPSQVAALGAMEVGAAYAAQFTPALADVRRLVADALATLGDRVTVAPPQGAFYVFARVQTDLDDLTLVRRLIEEHRVAVIPGSTFGVADGCTLRIAYGALQRDTVAEAMERLVHGLDTILRG